MGRATWIAAASAALACGGLASAGCGGDDEVARRAGRAGDGAGRGGRGRAARRRDQLRAAHRLRPLRSVAARCGAERARASSRRWIRTAIRSVWATSGASTARASRRRAPSSISRGRCAGAPSSRCGSRRAMAAARASRSWRPRRSGTAPPRISNLTIQPAGKITAAGPITAVATGDDPDGDPVAFEYTWTVNGEHER